jgi:aryl-alcohol dehydrogenase-like predicted oxidoreductase
MKIKRREFLTCSLVGVGDMLLGSKLTQAQEVKPKFFDPYELVPLGKTKIKVSRVGLGTGMRGWKRQSNQTRLGEEKFAKLIRSAYERGIRLFDLADLYGTHPYLIPALKKIPRKDFAIVSKIWWAPNGLPEEERPDADVVVERFLKELKTDYIDAILLHCVTSEKWSKELEKQMNILSKLKKKGTIRALGVSCHSLPALKVAAKEPWVDTVNTRINPYGIRMDDKPEKVVPVLQKIHQAGKGVIGMKIIGEGEFSKSDEKRNRSVQFALGLGCVDAMIVGFENVK